MRLSWTSVVVSFALGAASAFGATIGTNGNSALCGHDWYDAWAEKHQAWLDQQREKLDAQRQEWQQWHDQWTLKHLEWVDSQQQTWAEKYEKWTEWQANWAEQHQAWLDQHRDTLEAKRQVLVEKHQALVEKHQQWVEEYSRKWTENHADWYQKHKHWFGEQWKNWWEKHGLLCPVEEEQQPAAQSSSVLQLADSLASPADGPEVVLLGTSGASIGAVDLPDLEVSVESPSLVLPELSEPEDGRFVTLSYSAPADVSGSLDVAPVPEPSSFGLLAAVAVAGGIAAARRRRRSR